MEISTKSFREKMDELLQEEPSTRDRSTGFRILVGALIVMNVFFIIYCLFR